MRRFTQSHHSLNKFDPLEPHRSMQMESALPMPSTMDFVTEVQAENFLFRPTAQSLSSSNILFLGGAGVRGLNLEGKYVKFTASGIYLEDKALPLLATKWKGKSAEELADTDEFFRDIITGPFEKLTHSSFITQLTGQQYSEKVSQNCISVLKSNDTYGDEEAGAIDRFLEAFKDQCFSPGSSVIFNHLTNGSFVISFFEHESVAVAGIKAVIESKHLAEAFLETIIGAGGVCPEARKSLATRLAKFMN